MLEGPDSAAMRQLAQLWPMKRFPMLVDGDRTILEASCIIEYLGLHHPGPVRLIPEDPPIGRASCRERVCQYVEVAVGAVSFKQKKNKTDSLQTKHQPKQ